MLLGVCVYVSFNDLMKQCLCYCTRGTVSGMATEHATRRKPCITAKCVFKMCSKMLSEYIECIVTLVRCIFS